MINEVKTIPQRLKTISTYLKAGSIFADIGSDHALLPVYVCMHDVRAKAIAGEVNQGPYQSALDNVRRYHLRNRIDVRLGDGLDILYTGEVSELVIAGMGGTLITTILEKGCDKLNAVETLIIQPNNNEKKTREWLENNQFTITNEAIIKENGHIYEIIVGTRLNPEQIDVKPIFTHRTEEQEKQWMFGPLLLKNKSAVFYEKWSQEKLKHEAILKQIKQARYNNEAKIKQFEKEISWMEEVLS